MSEKLSCHQQRKRRELLKKQLEPILRNENLDKTLGLIDRMANELDCSALHAAAAMLFLYQPRQRHETRPAADKHATKYRQDLKMIRYRLEVGRQDRVSVEQIKKLMVDEAGVEYRLIGDIKIHRAHSTISLPEGMPADIFQHLKDVEINQQPLNIKRLRGRNRKPGHDNLPPRGRHRNFPATQQGRQAEAETNAGFKRQQKD